MSDKYDIHLIRPDQAFFSRGQGGVFQGVVDGKTYDELVAYRAFPFLYTDRFISIRTAKGEELGIMEEIGQLDEESGRELTKELRFRYFLPRVTRVDSVKQKSDLWIWELHTTLGPTKVVMRNLHEHMQFPGGNRIILTDINGKRCEIADWKALDNHSRTELTDVV